MPVAMTNVASIRMPMDFGAMSPYPTVVIETKAHQIPSTMPVSASTSEKTVPPSSRPARTA